MLPLPPATTTAVTHPPIAETMLNTSANCPLTLHTARSHWCIRRFEYRLKIRCHHQTCRFQKEYIAVHHHQRRTPTPLPAQTPTPSSATTTIPTTPPATTAAIAALEGQNHPPNQQVPARNCASQELENLIDEFRFVHDTECANAQQPKGIHHTDLNEEELLALSPVELISYKQRIWRGAWKCWACGRKNTFSQKARDTGYREKCRQVRCRYRRDGACLVMWKFENEKDLGKLVRKVGGSLKGEREDDGKGKECLGGMERS